MALIKCPECGSDISTLATACPKCGYPVNNIDRKASQQNLNNISQNINPKRKSYRKIIIWTLILTSLIIIALVYNKNKSSIDHWLFGGTETPYVPLRFNSSPVYVPTEHTKYLIQGSIVARANEQYRHIEFSTVAGSSNNKVVGRFQAYGGSGNDIRIMIMTQDDYTNFINGHNVSTYYNSGVKTVANLDVSLPSGHGSYDLVIDNFFSIVTDKEVQANIKLISTY
jgi:hypothetical protein